MGSEDIYLESVGCYINSASLCTYAALKNGGYDLETETLLDDCCEEWHNSLDDDDNYTIKQLENDFYENLHQQARDLMAELDVKYNRNTCLSLDEYLIEYRNNFTQKEVDKIEDLLFKF